LIAIPKTMNGTLMDYPAILARLRAGETEMPWPERRDLVARLAEEMSGDGTTQSHIELIEILAGDPKWEVRRDVADMLLLLPESDFVRLAARLSEDLNAFVRGSAERALARHRKGQRACQRQDRVSSQWEAFERLHGRQALSPLRVWTSGGLGT
jgi:hypothetical protein